MIRLLIYSIPIDNCTDHLIVEDKQTEIYYLHHTENDDSVDTPMIHMDHLHSSVQYQIPGYSACRGEVPFDLASEEKFFPCFGATTGSFLRKKKDAMNEIRTQYAARLEDVQV